MSRLERLPSDVCVTTTLATIPPTSVEHLKRQRDTLAASDAKRNKAARQLVAKHRVDQLGRPHSTRRMRSTCCARAASGHAAAPPRAASSSRRPMVTVIRPSRAKCVKGTIPRHERAVLTARQQHPHSWHFRAGGGAVHSINSGLMHCNKRSRDCDDLPQQKTAG